VIRYRSFRNTDPPAIAEIWNDAFTGRGAYQLRTASPFERWIFSKAYFDPKGFIIACDEAKPIGFTLCGFGPNESQSGVDPTVGVICLMAVHTQYRRHGVGSQLLIQAEQYLRARGAKTIYAGPMRPYNPFSFGLYGGSDSPGFLTSDPAAAPFFEFHGYEGASTTLVFQRKLDQSLNVVDGRFATLRRKYEVQILPRTTIGSWWQECIFGPLEPVEFRLEDKLTGHAAARTLIWEMEGFGWRWNYPAAGVIDLQVRPELRRHGLAKFLVTQLLRYLQDQYFGVLEVQIPERNSSASALFRSLGFEQVDVGRMFRRPRTGTGSFVDLPPIAYDQEDGTGDLIGDGME